VTKFQFSSLFNAAWLQTTNPAIIISGFYKVGVSPFNAGVIKPCTDVDDASDENPSSRSSTSGPSCDDYTGFPSHYNGIIEDVEANSVV